MRLRGFHSALDGSILAMAVSVGVAGCLRNQEPCSDVRKGDRLTIELVSKEWGNEDAGQDCLPEWGLSLGMTLQATVVGLEDSDPCRTGRADIEGVENWTWTWALKGPPSGGPTLNGLYDVESGECKGRAELKLGTDDEVNCEPTDELCHLSVWFDPSFDADDCPAYCAAGFRVRVKRQK